MNIKRKYNKNKIWIRSLWILIWVAIPFRLEAVTDTLFGEFNEHCYIAISNTDGIDWQTANVISAEMGGHLAAINSPEENEFIISLIKDSLNYWIKKGDKQFDGPWIGGYQESGATEPDGAWKWVIGEPFIYQNWADGEPNNQTGNEDRICFVNKSGMPIGQWNDYKGSMMRNGFIIEMDNVLEIDAGNNTSIKPGDKVKLGGAPTVTKGKPPYEIFWSPVESLDDPSSANPFTAPLKTTMYYITVIPETGCPKTDSVLVIIESGEIVTNIDNFPPAICGNISQSEIILTNTGLDFLIIDTMYFEGINAESFSLSPQFQKKPIAPGANTMYNIIFSASDIGVSNADLVIISNANPDSILIIPISARKDSISLITGIDLLELGGLCYNEQIDTVFTVKNNGTIPAGIKLLSSGLFRINPTEDIIPVDSTHNYALHFDGSATKIDINSQIKIIDSICAYTENINITVKISEPEIIASDIYLISSIGKYKEGKITISNIGDRDVYVSEPLLSDPRFMIISPSFPLQIPKFSDREINIRFTPDDDSHIEFDLEIKALPCDISTKARVAADALSGYARLKMGSAEALDGDKVKIPVYLIDTLNFYPYLNENLKTELSFNMTLLVPEEDTPGGYLSGGKRIVPLSFPLSGLKDSVLSVLTFKATLGNSEETALELNEEETLLSDADAIVLTTDGEFRLLGVCKEGGERLLSYNGEMFLSVSPNPTVDMLNIEYALIEDGQSELFIINTLGQQAISLLNELGKRGTYSLIINSKDLATGTYFVILRTPTGLITRRLEIIR